MRALRRPLSRDERSAIRTRAALTLQRAGFSRQEIAVGMGITERQVTTLLGRVRALHREVLQHAG